MDHDISFFINVKTIQFLQPLNAWENSL